MFPIKHYENTPIKYKEIFTSKTENFPIKIIDMFHISAQNIDCDLFLSRN